MENKNNDNDKIIENNNEERKAKKVEPTALLFLFIPLQIHESLFLPRV